MILMSGSTSTSKPDRFDWREYFGFAQFIVQRASDFPNEEAAYRSAVSRAYYAAFCTARTIVSEKDNKSFYSDEHRSLQDYLTTHSNKTRKSIGNRLKQLHQLRKQADYDDILKRGNAQYLAQSAMGMATNIMNDLEAIS